MHASVQMALQKSHSICPILPLVFPRGDALAPFFAQLNAVDPGYKKIITARQSQNV